MTKRIRYSLPSVSELEVSYVTDAVRNGWGSQCYDYIKKFERSFCDFIGVKHVVATSSCTGAMHMGLAALGVGRGDEVIIADMNWIACVAPVVYLGAQPVFVDIKPDTLCIDPEAVARAITPRTRAVIAVHLYGSVCDLDRLSTICDQHGIVLVEDCAESVGSRWGSIHTGAFGRFGVFSFHGTKTLTMGEGGVLATNDESLFKRVTTLSNHGRSAAQAKQFWPDELGYKYKLSNLQAAMGCAQLERANELIAAKRRVFDYYKSRLGNIAGLTLNYEPPGTTNGYWMPTAVFAPECGVTRERLMDRFQDAGIDARPVFYPLSSLPMFQPKPENRHSYDIPERAINLPSYPDMTQGDQDTVIEVIKRLL